MLSLNEASDSQLGVNCWKWMSPTRFMQSQQEAKKKKTSGLYSRLLDLLHFDISYKTFSRQLGSLNLDFYLNFN